MGISNLQQSVIFECNVLLNKFFRTALSFKLFQIHIFHVLLTKYNYFFNKICNTWVELFIQFKMPPNRVF